MKLLRNPFVVGVLAVAAVVLVVNSLMSSRAGGSLWQRLFPKSAPAATATQSTAKPAATPVKPAKAPASKAPAARSTAARSDSATASRTVSTLDVAAVRADASGWIESPRRDPFHGRSIDAAKTGPKAGEVLILSGIWRQTDSTFAIINQRVVSQGEIIQGFTVDRIDTDRVWVEGPNGREPLEFKVLQPVPATAAPAGAGDDQTTDDADNPTQPDSSDPAPGR